MRFTKQSVIQASPERVFAFHEQPDVLSLLLPPWESARVIQPAKISEVGSQAIIETKIFGPITAQWVAQHTVYEPPHLFEDVQVRDRFAAGVTGISSSRTRRERYCEMKYTTNRHSVFWGAAWRL